MKNIKRVAAVHDISGFGKASLTVVIPILSTLGIQVCPLPTAVLSSITEFPHARITDLTDFLDEIIQHWQELGLKFDAVYSGFLGSPSQVNMVKRLIKTTVRQDSLIIVDPVMGDKGKLYSPFTPDIIMAMKELILSADVITPNVTEAAFLLDKPQNLSLDQKQIIEWLFELAELGPDTVIITSVQDYDDPGITCVFAYCQTNKEIWKMSCQYLPADFPGTGDTFSSIVTGFLLNDYKLPSAIEKAVNFIYHAIELSIKCVADRRQGLYLEPILHLLHDPLDKFTISRITL